MAPERIYCVYLLSIYFCFIGLLKVVESYSVRSLYDACPEGFFGYKCKFECQCRGNRPCSKTTGSCPRGCKDGLWGPGCQLSNGCYYNSEKRSYMGTLSTTKYMYTCQRWESKIPHSHTYKEIDFADKTYYPLNYCRTTGDSDKPWCYTTDSNTRWQYCTINNCGCPAGRFGTNCAKECHCRDDSERCDSVLGECRSKCAPGWSGLDCQIPQQCPPNRHGWACGKSCQCVNSNHCDRFLGPKKECRCKVGFYNPPQCEPVKPPRIVSFGNNKVNPGQPTIFNCTVGAVPTPLESEIRLIGPQGRRITLVSSKELDQYHFTRISIFKVNYVMPAERFSCYVQAVAGDTQMSTVAEVYELPRINTQPQIARGGRTSRNITLVWLPWDIRNGDLGDGPVLWYNIKIKHERDPTYIRVGQVNHSSCKTQCRYTLANLEPNAKYGIAIYANRDGAGGEGAAGPAIHIRTKCGVPQMPPTIHNMSGHTQYNVTYPKTKIVIHWKKPIQSTILCDRIERYIITVVPERSRTLDPSRPIQGRTVIADGSGELVHSVEDLEPFTQYCIVIVVENNAGLKSPPSTRKCIVTPPTTPAPPDNFRFLYHTSTSVALSWNEPKRNHGLVSSYHILYWEGDDEKPKGREWKGHGQNSMELTLNGLKPNTFYRILVKAVNTAGTGEPSKIITITTEEGVPSPVRELTNVSKTTTTLGLKWQNPEATNGELKNFIITCRPIETLSGQPLIRMKPIQLPVDVFEWTVRNLLPATLYRCHVNATTMKGAGQGAELEVWTSPKALTPPVSPVITKVTENTVTLELHKSNDKSISHYRLIVERLDDVSSTELRKKRHAPRYIEELSLNFYTAARDGENAYVTAQFSPERLRSPFVVGDNNTYDGYFNGPLQQDRRYKIWLGAFSSVDGKHQRAFAKADRPIIARSMASAASTSPLPIIIGIILVFIVIIVIFAILLIMWRRRHNAEEREKTEMPSFGPTVFPEPDPDPSTPPTPIGRMVFPFAENVEMEPLIEAHSTDILLDTEPVYTNTTEIIESVKVEDLWDYIRTAKQGDLEGLKREFKLLPAGITSTCEIAHKNENKFKNRYGNIIAYDHTRVVLDPEGDDEHDDYINANYIDGYNKQRSYIAAQGPSKPTLGDIWRMVWKENSKTLIMLTNSTESGKKKCEQYWPDEGCHQYGNISVQLLDVDVMPDFTVRTFLISKGGQSKYVKQFHFTTWPDHGVPRFGHSLLLFRQKIRAYDSLDNGTVVIHCSAGVGRTGTYIAVDTQLEKAKSEGIIDVHNFVQLMRTQRVNMVQTLEQYVFVYDALLEALICGDTTVSSHAFPEVYTDLCLFDNEIGKTKLEEQFEILKLLSTTIERDESTTALLPDNIFKNRCKNIIPANRCRPYLMTTHNGSNDYINAVFFNSYCRKDQLLITQMPLPNTVVDFWRLIYDHRSYCIIMLNEVETEDDTCEQYWSEDLCGATYGPFQVETTAELKSNPIVTVRDFTLTNTQVPANEPRHIRQFHFHRWQEGSSTPSSQRSLTELVEMVEMWQQTQPGPVTVHCMNGASRSGLFCAALTILERLKKEKEVDVFQAVKQLRLNRSQVIDNMEQYRFCHEYVMELLSSPTISSTVSSPLS